MIKNISNSVAPKAAIRQTCRNDRRIRYDRCRLMGLVQR